MTGISTFGRSLEQIQRFKVVQEQFGTLSTQLASGKKTQKFSGLGNDVMSSQSARANFQTLDNYISNANNAERRISLALRSIEEFQAQAENFLNELVGFVQGGSQQQGDIVYFDDPGTPNIVENIAVGYTSAEPSVELSTLQNLADSIFGFTSSLLNAQDGERFLLAGAETNTKPFTDTGLLDAAISSRIADWKAGTITTDELVSSLKSKDATVDPNAITDTITGYSLSLSAGTTKDVSVRVHEASEIDITVLANDSAFRDVMVAVSYFKSENMIPIADEVDPTTFAITTAGAPGATNAESEENFYQVFNELTALVTNAVDRIDQIRFKLESAKARVQEVKINHQDTKNFLLGTISTAEDVDINEVAVQINALQIQLDASFRVTAMVSQLSLVNFM